MFVTFSVLILEKNLQKGIGDRKSKTGRHLARSIINNTPKHLINTHARGRGCVKPCKCQQKWTSTDSAYKNKPKADKIAWGCFHAHPSCGRNTFNRRLGKQCYQNFNDFSDRQEFVLIPQ